MLWLVAMASFAGGLLIGAAATCFVFVRLALAARAHAKVGEAAHTAQLEAAAAALRDTRRVLEEIQAERKIVPSRASSSLHLCSEN